MRTLLVTLFACILSFGLVAPDAEAKRFGGGKSFGKSFSTPKSTKPAAAPTSQKTATNTAGKTAQPKKRSGFGGLMAGLLAGGLLGAMFFGDGFDGIQFMDILLIGLLAFVAFKIFSILKKGSRPNYAGAGAGMGGVSQQGAQQPQNFKTSEPQSFQASEPVAKPSRFNSGGFGGRGFVLPAWFNENNFLEGGKQHFAHLQKAWDNNDWDDIRTYVSPDVLQHLQAERAKLADAQHTEVVSVMAEMANFIDNGDHVIATINFYGWMKEDSDQTTEFSELWHLMRDMSQENADWMIVGIEQPS